MNKEPEKSKRAYIKPDINKVKLEAQDAVLANCKNADGPYKRTGRCETAGGPPPCRNRAVGS